MKLFFELIQVSIGSKEKLSSVPSTAEWEKLFVLAEKHAVIGMCFHGIQILYKYQSSQMVNLPIKLKMQWLGITSNIQIENDLLNKRAKEVTLLFAEGGFDSVVLKGQGIARLYSDSSLRQSGDIDLWVKGSREDVIAFMYWKKWKVGRSVVHHTDVEIFSDASVEVHHYPSYTYSPIRWLKYKKWFREQEKIQFKQMDRSVGFCCPSLEFNLVYVLLHIYRHVFHEGIGLRQLMDYYMVLQAASKSKNENSELRGLAMKILRRFGLERFAGAVMYVEQLVFGMKDDMLLCSPNIKAGQFLLNEIMRAGNFGKYDERIQNAHKGGLLALYLSNIKRLSHYTKYYPSEVLWAPFWKVGHFFWRRAKGF